MKIYSNVTGDNSDLIETVAKQYIKPLDKVADVTFGKGVFWKKVDVSQFSFFPTDLKTVAPPVDFCNLPYADCSMNVVVFDPPYMHNVGKPIVDGNYQNSATTKGMYHKDIIELYRKGMMEAFRVLKPGGYLFVKCQDEIESGRQAWSHIEIYEIAVSMGMYGKDLFVLSQKNLPIIQHKRQLHARKNHSYLWVFEKVTSKQGELL